MSGYTELLKNKWFLIVITVLLIGIIGYFCYNKYNKNSNKSNSEFSEFDDDNYNDSCSSKDDFVNQQPRDDRQALDSLLDEVNETNTMGMR